MVLRIVWRAWLPMVPAAFLIFAVPAAAQSAAQIEALEAALDRRDPFAVERLLAEIIIARRPADGVLRVDPLLSSYVGRVQLQHGRTPVAIPYLEQAQSADLPDVQRVEARFALAEAFDLVGSREAAAQTLDGLGREPLTVRQRQRLDLALAEREMIGNPAAALERLSALDSIDDPVLRFEADLLAARAQSLSGNLGAAREAAARAWAEAVGQPAHVLAPLRAALVIAGLAVESDHDQTLVMLNVARAADIAIDTDAIASLPICGEDGVTPDDRVTFALYRDLAWQRLVPVSASRPSVVAPFVRALTGRPLIERHTNLPAGTLVAVQCRSVPSSDWQEVPSSDQLARIFAENGVYVRGVIEWNGERVSALEESIAQIEARGGDDDPALVPLLLELIQLVSARTLSSGASSADLADLNRRMTRAVRRLRGADQLTLPTESEESAMLEASGDPVRSMALWESMMIDRIGRRDFASAFEFTQRLADEENPADARVKRRAVSTLLQRARSHPDDRARRALLMRLGEIQTDAGEFDGAISSFRAAGAGADSCLVVHNGIRSSRAEITDDAYPDWANRFGATGITAIEHGIDGEGRVVRQRVIFSVPGGLFDAAATEAFGAGYLYAPRRPGSRPRSCGGTVVNMIWRMPDPEGDEAPVPFDLFGPDPI